MNLNYMNMDGYLVPDLKTAEQQPVGKYGLMRLAFLKESRPSMYDELLLTQTLNSHLREIDQTAAEQVEMSLNQMMQTQEGPDKATDPMGWTGWMNNLKATAEQQVMRELVYN